MSTNRLIAGPSRRGFTLIELLVALAIFTTIMAGVTLMFNSVVRTTKQGYLNQQAYETLRGTLSILEEDLTRSFGSRATGHKHTFYGTPFGFTFIGLVPAKDSDEFNLARITYVIYGGYEHPELQTIYDATIDDDNEDQTTDERKRHTYSLLRYIELGQDDLESFPIDWNSALLGSEDADGELHAILRNAVSSAFDKTLCGSDPNILSDAAISNDPCLGGVRSAKQRELWMRMLAGDPSLPRFWDDGVGGPTVRLDSALSRDPADYVLAENIMAIRRNQDDTIEPPFDPDNTDTYTPLDLVDPFDSSIADPFMDITGNDVAIIELRDSAAYPSTPFALYREHMNAEYGRTVFSSLNYFFGYREYDSEILRVDADGFPIYKVSQAGLLQNPTSTLPEVQETELTAREFAYWNDTRNLEYNTFTNEYISLDAIANSDILDLDATVPGDRTRSVLPDILDPALPESILIELAFFYPSPYPSAPDFQRVFTHRVNLPTGYKRKSESFFSKEVRREE